MFCGQEEISQFICKWDENTCKTIARSYEQYVQWMKEGEGVLWIVVEKKN